nr:MAG TPA: minor tail protein [Caudoviricetes sp.]
MAKEIKFNIKLLVDGKEKLVTATSTVAELHNVLESAKTEADKLDKVLVNFNQRVEKFQNINNAISQIAGTLSTVTEESRTFSAAMNAANTMAGKGGEDFAKLKGEVAELSKTLPVAREELANGLYQVISNGVPEDNWIAYLQKSAKASVGGIADLGETVKVTSTIIKNYGLSWDKAGDVQDKIQLTAKNGVTSFEQLAQALPRVTSNAATLGVSIDELMATFATLTGVSGNTAEVSTQLAAIFTALVKPSSEASKMAQQMGIEFDAAAIKAAGGMRNFLTDLDKNVKAYASKSGMLEQEIYGKLFGSAESLRALGPLTGQLAVKFGENVEAMKGSAGTIDDAFATMSSSGAASFQILKNKIGEFTDGIASAMGGIMPYLNITSQVGNSIVAVLTLNRALKTFGVTQGIVKTRIIATNAAALVWNATAVRVNAIVKVISATFRGAAVSATTLKLAIQGLLVSTGVGIAIVALTEIMSAFMSKSDEAKTSAEDAAESMKGMGDAADEVKDAYNNALQSTFSDLMGKYDKLKAAWKSLSSEQKKVEWIKENQSAFNELRLKINDVSEAENIFNRKTDAVVEAFKQRAMAAAYAAKLTALYQKQIALLDKKQKVTKSIADDAKQGGRHAKEGDIVPESWRSDRYGKVGSDGQWRFTKIGAERYNGTNVSGNTQINSVDKELNNVDREIAATQKQLTERLKSANSFITADKPTAPTPAKTTPKTTPGKHDTTAEPKTHLEELQAQLSAAQKEKGNAMTVEARVKADAKIQDIQAQIDEATKGKVSIEAETEPSYIVQGSDADKRQSHNNAGQRIDRIRQDFEIGLIGKEDAERQIADINKQLEKLGVKPIEVHFKTYIEELQEQLHDAQREFDEATTIEAKVKADAKIDEIQAQIDEATKGKVSIEAEAEPSYIVKGSKADKRQSYANAQSKANSVQSDYEAGIINKEEALKSIDDINADLEKLNLTPVKIEVETEDIDKAKEKMSGACDAIKSMGSSLSGLGDAIEVPELNVAGTMAQAIATMVDGYATATAQAGKLGPWAWVAFAATGLATLTAMIASVKQAGAFATGGIVGGTSSSGDKKFARVNSGEMILNKFQQTRLFNMVNGNFQPPTFTAGEMQPVTMNNISNSIEPSATIVNVHLNANARKMLEVLSNTKKVTGKSGRVYNV